MGGLCDLFGQVGAVQFLGGLDLVAVKQRGRCDCTVCRLVEQTKTGGYPMALTVLWNRRKISL